MRTTLAIVCIAIFLGRPAFAQDIVEYSTAGDWKINIDQTVGDGCFVLAEYERGSLFRLGMDRNQDIIYVIWGDPDWRSIEFGKNYDLEVQFGDESAWSGTAQGFSFDPPENQPFLQLEADSDAGADFVLEFMQEQFVKVNYQGKEILHLSLEGSFQAGLQLLECQQSVDKWERDPFQEAPATNEDPFR